MKIPRFALWSGTVMAGCLSAIAAEQTNTPAQTPAAATASAASTTAALPAGTPATLGQIQAMIVQGDVQLIDKDGTAAPLTRGHKFTGEGNTIKAGANGQALLVFSNGTTIKVLPNTTVKAMLFRQAPFDEQAEGAFLRLSADPSRSDIVLNLAQGNLQGEFKKPNKGAGSTFVINTTKGPVNIEGGFSISATGEITKVERTTQPTPAKTTTSAHTPNGTPAVVQLTVDPKTGAITGGSISGNATNMATALDLADALTDTINAAKTNAANQVKQN